VTLIGLAEAPVTSSVARPGAPDDSSAAELAVEIWTKGRSVSWIASSEIADRSRIAGGELHAVEAGSVRERGGAGVDRPDLNGRGRALGAEQLSHGAGASRHLEALGLRGLSARAGAVGEGSADRLAIHQADVLEQRTGQIGAHFGKDVALH